MDKAEIKVLLSSFRNQDADDPIFEEALQAAASDPELASWFEEMQRFDHVMSSKFQALPVPADVKSRILIGGRLERASMPQPRRYRIWAMAGSIAAVLIAGLMVWHLYLPGRRPVINALALRAISYTDDMPPLQFVCFNAAAVAGWINRQPGSKAVGLRVPEQPASMSMKMIGSSITNWEGRPVVMICLQNGKHMAMLYILKGSEAPDIEEGTSETVQQASWVVRTTKTEGQVRLLTAKGGPEDLDYLMPF